jgi:outer membrane protein assembly factor BamB
VRLLALLLILSGCGLGAGRWAQFHADGANQGSIGVTSMVAVEPRWSLDVGPVLYSSPVIGGDGTIYVGTVSGDLVAVRPDGTVRWRRAFPNTPILASPAVGADGSVYVVTNQKADTSLLSTLHRVSPSDGTVAWSYPFPNGGFTTGSPKTWSAAGSHFVFVYVRRSSEPLRRNEIFVLDRNGQVLRRETAQGCSTDLVGTGGWDWLTTFLGVWARCFPFGCTFVPAPVPPGGTAIPFYQSYGWPDPTPAIVDFPGVEPLGQPIVIVVDDCAIMAYRWQAPVLALLWGAPVSGEASSFSSPAVTSQLVLGDIRGRVRAFDYLSGVKLWEYDAGEAVMGSPASLGRQVYVASLNALHVLDSSGVRVAKRDIGGQTVASPALTPSAWYVSSAQGVHTLSLDLLSQWIDARMPAGLSSPAIGGDGSVYTVTSTGVLRSYPGP